MNTTESSGSTLERRATVNWLFPRAKGKFKGREGREPDVQGEDAVSYS
jgi:hypothetical protein